jgi:hypothetical protein
MVPVPWVRSDGSEAFMRLHIEHAHSFRRDWHLDFALYVSKFADANRKLGLKVPIGAKAPPLFHIRILRERLPRRSFVRCAAGCRNLTGRSQT